MSVSGVGRRLAREMISSITSSENSVTDRDFQ
jgi:hypothetical protein